MDMSRAMAVLGIVMMAAMVGFILWAVLVGFRDRRRPDGQRAGARATLDERYARGEIDDEEYERRRRMLDRPG